MPFSEYTPEQDWAEWSVDDLTLFEIHRAAIVSDDEASHDRTANPSGSGSFTLPGKSKEAIRSARDRLRARGLLESSGAEYHGSQPDATHRLTSMGKRVALAAPTPLPRPCP